MESYNTFKLLLIQTLQPMKPGQGAETPAVAPKTNRPSCMLCRQEYRKQRKTRNYCFSCNDPVCAEHSEQLYRCNKCKVCVEEL